MNLRDLLGRHVVVRFASGHGIAGTVVRAGWRWIELALPDLTRIHVRRRRIDYIAVEPKKEETRG